MTIRLSKLILLFSISIFSLISCRKTVYRSSAKSDAIKIDGDRSEWQSGIFLVKDNPIALGLQNDENNLYIMMATKRRDLKMAIMKGGLQVGIKTESTDFFRIDYPQPMDKNTPHHSMKKNSHQINQKNIDQQIEHNHPKDNQKIDCTLPDEIVITNDDDVSIIISRSIFIDYGIEVSVNNIGNELIYELKIPIAATEYSLPETCFNEDHTIELSVATGDFETESSGKHTMGDISMSGRGSSMGKGMGGGASSGKGGRGSRKGGNQQDSNSQNRHKKNVESPKAFDFDINIMLAKPETFNKDKKP